LGSAEYVKSDASTQSLDRPFVFELHGLQNESPAVIQEALAGYLAENGWAANTASMGNVMESNLAVCGSRWVSPRADSPLSGARMWMP
jgi:hypothetical protein